MILLTLGLGLASNALNAQSESDSLQQIRNDSAARILLLIKSFPADEANVQTPVDTNSSLLHFNQEYSRSLNNFYSPQFKISNDRYSQKIYDHGINSMTYFLSGFDNYQFIIPNKPIAEILTNRGRAFSNSQADFSDNFDIHLIFAENFRNRMLWNFSYDKDNYKGIYANGRQKNSIFTTGVQYTDPKDKFHLNVLYIDERHSMENNWGIASDSILTDPNYSIRESIPVNNTTATTSISERSIGINTDFPINLKSEVFRPVCYLKSFYSTYSFLYFDPGIDSLKRVFQSLWTDSFSINHILTQKIWTNSLGIRLFASDKMESTLGIRYEHQMYDHDTFPSIYNVFQLDISGRYRLNTNIELHGNAKLKRYKSSFAPDIQITLNLKNKKYFSSKMSVFLKSDPIPYIYQHLVLNKKIFWNNTFDNNFIKETGLQISIETEKYIHSAFSLSLSNYSNFIYLDTLPQAIERNNINKLKLQFKLPIKYKWLQLNSQFNYDVLSPDPMNFSGWNSSHQLSINRSLFKKVVNADIGCSLNVYDYKHKLKFNPVIQLYHATEIPNDMFYSVGMFLHFQISEFKLVVDLENLDSFWIKKRPSLVTSYPFYDFFFKFGLQWKFIN